MTNSYQLGFEQGGGDSALSLKKCYALAWRSFKKWWIPLCFVSAFILLFEVIPRVMLRPETNQLKQAIVDAVSVFKTGTLEEMEVLLQEIQSLSWGYTEKLSKLLLVGLPFISLLSMVLLAWANVAVKNRRNTHSLRRMIVITGAHLFLALIKGLAFLVFILPGFYIYTRLFFVTLIMLEEDDAGMVDAVKKSWRMTQGHFWNLLTLICLNSTLQVLVAPSLIGLIPVTGFANTARAAAYQMVKLEIAY